MIVVIDWETKDEYMYNGYGAGWVFALQGYTSLRFDLLGMSIRAEDDNRAKYYTNLSDIWQLLDRHKNDTLVMHNGMYDVGCLLVLAYRLGHIIDLHNCWTMHDTLYMAKLVCQDAFSYSLENCCKRYGCVNKDKKGLCDFAWESGLYKEYYAKTHINKKGNPIKKKTRPTDKILYDYIITNLDLVPTEINEQYCNADVDATYELYWILLNKIKEFKGFDLNKYSDLLKICIDIKRTGVSVDINQAIKTRDYLTKRAEDIEKEVYKEIGYEFNIFSSSQLIKALKKYGLTGFTITDLGNDSANKKWLEMQPDKICEDIVKYKNYNKLVKDFLVKIVKYQQIHKDNNSNSTKIHPNFNILGATATGRMSSSAGKRGKLNKELNMQQIPKRGSDPEASKYIRGIFVADEGETWISADYSTQEQRLQIEYALRLVLDSANLILAELQKDKYTDIHMIVATMASIERVLAKTIGLGLAYGMGGAKLSKSLKLPTKWITNKYGRVEIAGDEAQIILDKYHNAFPYMKQLINKAMESLKQNGYIKTIGNRRLYNDSPILYKGKIITFEYKGLSKLIQGSGADMITQAMINCWGAGLKILLVVHDEINISTCNPLRDRLLLIQGMENTYPMQVPMAVEVTEGRTWAG